MAHLAELWSRIQKLKIDDQSQPGLGFVPRGVLADTFSLEDITHALAQLPFNVPLHRRESASETIIERGLVVFATILESDLCQYLEQLLQEDLLDRRLPFSAIELEPILGEDAKRFISAQWTFLPHEFQYHAYHRRLPRGVVLPYTSMERIGKGRNSKVFKVKIHSTCNGLVRGQDEKNDVFVRKEVDIAGLSETNADKKESELLYYLRALRHECIIELLTSYSLNGVPNLIFRCADYDLGHFLQNPRPITLSRPHQILKALHGLCCGLRHLHEYRLTSHGGQNSLPLTLKGCHHDLKPKNVLVRGNMFILSDFGLSSLKDMEQDSKTPWQNATFEYGAPECRNPETFRSGRVGRASDVWSLGCIVLEVLTYIHGGPDSTRAFKESRRYEGKQATTYAFHHDGAASHAVASQIDMLIQPSAEDENAIAVLYLRDMFALEALDRPTMAVVEPRILHSTLQTIIVSLLPAIERHLDRDTLGARSNANVFRAQMLLEIGRFKSWATTLDLLPDRTDVQSAIQQPYSAMRFPETYQLLDKAHTTIAVDSTSNRKDIQQQYFQHPGGCDDILPEIHQLNNRLHNLLGTSEKQKADQLFLALVRSVDDDMSLSMINTESTYGTSSEYKTAGQLAAMRYLSSLMLNSSNPSTARLDLALLSRDSSSNDDPSVGPSSYWYHFDHERKQKVHVERIRYGKKWIADPTSEEFKEVGEKFFERIHRLAAFLRDADKPARLRSLHCIGAYHSAEQKHFGLVYELPDRENYLITLNKLLDRRESHAQPDVDEKYCLAYVLAETLHYIHQSGWVHKNLNPMNVVFSHHSQRDFKEIAYREPYVIGFDYSRLETEDQYTDGPDERMRAEYQHPAYRSGTEAFKTPFDYYSFGLILLEIGLWSPLRKIYDRNREASPEVLAQIYEDQCTTRLLKAMPRRYANAVKQCFHLKGNDVQQDQMGFETKVLAELQSLAGPSSD